MRVNKGFCGIVIVSGFFLLAPGFVRNAAAKCKPDRIEIMSSSGFGLSFGGGASSIKGGNQLYAGIPVTVNGARGCWTQKSKLRFKVDASATENKGTMDVFPAQGEFENVPGGKIETYVLVQGQAPEVSVHAFSVACAGSSVLSLESFSGKTSALKKESDRVSSSTKIAVGMAAKNAQHSAGEIPAAFAALLKTPGADADCASCGALESGAEVHVPSVAIGSVISAPGLDTRSTFATTQLRQEICSEKMRAALSEFKAENYSGYSKWRKRLRVKWE